MADLLLPEGARLIHVGPHKTGSTAVQTALFAARERLATMGVFYPGGSYRRRKASEQLLAALQPDGTVTGPIRRWDTLVEEVASSRAIRRCVSDERFGKAPDHIVARIVADLGGDDAHVVAVARNYEPLLPSLWQERVKAGYTRAYHAWLKSVLTRPESAQAQWDLWHAHDTAALIDRWVRHVGPERFTLVVADESDRRHLLSVFEQLLGLPDGLLRSDPDRSNRSLGLAELELLRAMNGVHQSRGIKGDEYRRLARAGVLAAVRVSPEAQGPRRPALPPWAVPLVRARSEARVAQLRTTQVRVVGDLDNLLPSSGTGTRDDTGIPWVSAAAAGAVVAEVLREVGVPTDEQQTA